MAVSRARPESGGPTRSVGGAKPRAEHLLDQTKTPYFQALLDYVDSGVLPFHTPGHMQGRGSELSFREFVGDNILAIDLTPMPGIDDLLQPTASIKEAQELAAEAYGADNTFFLINGSTSGNQCMMMTALNPGEKIAVPRNSHKSMLGGLVMSGAHPIYMQPAVDQEMHMDHTVTPETVARTLKEHPDVKAVYVVSPTYYGVAADMEAIARITHDAGKLLLVDEAWGPHFKFHPALPLSATEVGADLSINSTHKMLSAFSQGAMLHQIGDRVRVDRLKAVLKMFLSTSPNLPMVASLDVARMQMATKGAALLSQTIELAQETRGRLNLIEGVYCFGEEIAGREGVFDVDPNEDDDTRNRHGLHRLRSVGDSAQTPQHSGRACRSVQRRRAFHDRHDAGRGGSLGFGIRRDGARRSSARHVRSIGHSRAAAQTRDVSHAADSADAHAAARGVPRGYGVCRVPQIGRPDLRRDDIAVSTGHSGDFTGRRDHAGIDRLPAP